MISLRHLGKSHCISAGLGGGYWVLVFKFTFVCGGSSTWVWATQSGGHHKDVMMPVMVRLSACFDAATTVLGFDFCYL